MRCLTILLAAACTQPPQPDTQVEDVGELRQAESCLALDEDADGDGVLARLDVELGPVVDAGPDMDGDGFPVSADPIPWQCVSELGWAVNAQLDCDDTDPTAFREHLVPVDADGDGELGLTHVPRCVAVVAADYAITDCDDTNATVGSNQTEQCDALDHDCDGSPTPAGGCSLEFDCADGIDNDQDGATDAADVDCPSGEDCSNGQDDDEDGLVDCEDADCIAACTEYCLNGLDNDGDGLAGCDDPDCAGDDACRGNMQLRVVSMDLQIIELGGSYSSWIPNKYIYTNVVGQARWFPLGVTTSANATYTCDFVVPRAARQSIDVYDVGEPAGCQGRVPPQPTVYRWGVPVAGDGLYPASGEWRWLP